MWEFKSFPAKIKDFSYVSFSASSWATGGSPPPKPAVIEIFGYSQVSGGFRNLDIILFCFREISPLYIGKMEFLPVKEFEDKFKKYKLIENK